MSIYRKLLCLLLIYVTMCLSGKSRYVSLERPVVSYFNPKYISHLNVSTQRYGRHDPVYYSILYFKFLCGLSNNVTIHLFFGEFITNMHTRTFLDWHFKLCDLIHKHIVLGPMLKQGKFVRPCPYPPGDYYLYNLTLPVEILPAVFPFTKGRMYLNITVTATQELMSSGYIDMEVKLLRQERKKKN